MEINKKLLLGIILLFLNCTSCQTTKEINYTKYEDLSPEKKQEIEEYLPTVKNMISKKDTEIILLFQVNCFLGNSININDVYTSNFYEKPNQIHHGQKNINYDKNLGKIKLRLSDGKIFVISQKYGFDYITICYNEKSDKLYVHYYDFPKMIIEE